ncbi:MAG: HipA domain-containing protein [Sporocytophaga sp.]|nr:HipA domain-containing protein [Sporocytophaga sp.]
MRRCLYCYQSLEEGDKFEYHGTCSKKIFGNAEPPELEYSNDQMLQLAEKVVRSQVTITGVQPKLSLGIKNMTGNDVAQKLTITGVWGEYILKPPTIHYPHLPELEDVTMHLAEIAGIKTVPHALIRLASGELSYITKRIDRKGKQKFHMEDMCQVTERLTEAKYRGSYEQIGKAIMKYSSNPGLHLIIFFEQVIFSFLTGNNDMHLKNFSLFKDPKLGYSLSLAYDMVAAALVVENDDEELALNLNGKKEKT